VRSATAIVRSSGPRASPSADSVRRSAITVSNRKARSSTGRPRSAREGSMKARQAVSSNPVAQSSACPAAAKQAVSAPEEQP
jgi:hypothetical protein